MIQDRSVVSLRASGGRLEAGLDRPTRVMALTGASRASDYDAQRSKVDCLLSMEDGPEIISDLSLISPNSGRSLWRQVVEDSPCVAASLPIYTTSRRAGRVDPAELLERSLEQIEGGVGLLTIHPTPTREIVRLAEERLVPWTSRGGGIVIRDLVARDWREENVYLRILPELIPVARRYGAVLSLGTSFRPANIFDTLDRAHRAEIASLLGLACAIAAEGVGVVVESPGHARPSDIREVAKMLRAGGFPVMPLGPIPTDAAIGMDHLAAAIGATLLGLEGCADILAAVTREEHTGGIPSIESTVEAIKSAKIAAHIIDIHLLNRIDPDRMIAEQRALNRTCVSGKMTPGCSRCAQDCPL